MAFREANPSSNTICVEPFKFTSLELRIEGGVAKANQKDTLTGLKVVYGNDKFRPGDTVYFEGEQCSQFWAKRVYTLGDTKFIIASVDLIKVIEREPPKALERPPPPEPTAVPPGGRPVSMPG